MGTYSLSILPWESLKVIGFSLVLSGWSLPESFQKNQTTTTMGDKSPKSKNKDSKQKKGKAAASDKAKQKLISDKQSNQPAPPKKKK